MEEEVYTATQTAPRIFHDPPQLHCSPPDQSTVGPRFPLLQEVQQLLMRGPTFASDVQVTASSVLWLEDDRGGGGGGGGGRKGDEGITTDVVAIDGPPHDALECRCQDCQASDKAITLNCFTPANKILLAGRFHVQSPYQGPIRFKQLANPLSNQNQAVGIFYIESRSS